MPEYVSPADLPRSGAATYTDTEALDRIAVLLGANEEWGVEFIEYVAHVVGRTDRNHPGDQTPQDLAAYRRVADLMGEEHDGPEDARLYSVAAAGMDNPEACTENDDHPLYEGDAHTDCPTCEAEYAAEEAAEAAADYPDAFRDDVALLASPAGQAVFDAIWRGEHLGFSEAKVTASLAECERLLADLEAGRIRPERIIGRHVRKPKTHARQYLWDSIAADRRVIETRGRSHAVNCSNVRYALRTTAAA